MISLFNKIIYYITLKIINTFLKGTKFFSIKKFLLNKIGITVGENTKIVGPIHIGYINKVSIGRECWIGKNFNVDGNGTVIIGDRCDIAPNLTINTGGHKIGEENRRAGEGLSFNTIIKSGTWIGTNVIIVNGANVGKSSIIAAGSVVITNVQDNTLAAGVPARIKKNLY